MVQKITHNKYFQIKSVIRSMLLVGVSFFVLCSTVSSAEMKTPIYTFGVVPQFDARRVANIWWPILHDLQQRTGIKFLLRGSPTIPEFEDEFIQGKYDFVYMNPYHILVANKKQGYLPLVKDVGRNLYGIVVVLKSSPIKNMKDLQGKVVAFPAPNALGASLMIRAAFLNKFNVTIEPKYVKTHSSVYLNVALGRADAGGGVHKTLMQQRPEVRDALRVVYETQRVAPHPISAHPRVPKKVIQQVKAALLAMGLSSQGQQLLAKIPIKKIGVAKMKDYRPLDKLGLDTLFDKPY